MRRAVFFMMATLTSVAVFGQGLLDCIEPDVLRALLLPQGQGERPPVITAATPAELSALKMPREFSWIGSAERVLGRVDASTNATSVTAAWRSSLAPEAARAAAGTALAASGWELRPMLGGPSNGFISSSMQTPLPACRDGVSVNVNGSVLDGVTYTLLTLQRGNNGNSICNQPARPAGSANTGLQRYMPRLDMPTDPGTGRAALSQSGSSGGSIGRASGGDSAYTQTEFTLKDSAGNVARHFAGQMAEQGWASDATWSGASTAGSSWSKRVDGNTLILGTLSVTAVDERRFVAVLRIIELQ